MSENNGVGQDTMTTMSGALLPLPMGKPAVYQPPEYQMVNHIIARGIVRPILLKVGPLERYINVGAHSDIAL